LLWLSESQLFYMHLGWNLISYLVETRSVGYRA